MHLTSLKNIILNLFPILIFFLTAIPVRVFGINYSSSTLNLTVNIIMYICVPIYLVILNYHQTQKNIFINDVNIVSGSNSYHRCMGYGN